MALQQRHHRERGERWDERGAALEHVATVDDRADDRRVGGRAPDAELLEPLHERRLGEARRRLGLVAVGGELACHQAVALGECGKLALLRVVGRLVGVLDVDPPEALVGDDGARGRELGVAPVGRRGTQAHGDGLADRVGHLRRDGAVPDHLVDPGLHRPDLGSDFGGRAEAVACWADGLVGLLRVLDLLGVRARGVRHELGAESLGDGGAGGGERGLRQRRAVGSHVGDVALLVERLRGAHRLGRRQPQLAAGFLLEGRGHERRRGTTTVGAGLDRAHREVGVGQPAGERRRGPLVEQRDLACRRGRQLAARVEVLAGGDAEPVDRDERRGELGGVCGRRGRRERALQVPVARRGERHPLPFALDDDAGGDALHAASRQLRHDLLPQDRRHLVAVQPVQQAPGLLGVDEAAVELARLVDGPPDRLGGDLVEHHAAHRHRGVERLEEVPGDGLSFAVLIRCEVELGGVLQVVLQPLDDVALLARHDVERLEVVVDVDAEARPRLPLVGGGHFGGVAGQVADVSHRRLHDVVVAEVPRDRARFGWGLDDDEGLAHRRQVTVTDPLLSTTGHSASGCRGRETTNLTAVPVGDARNSVSSTSTRIKGMPRPLS